MGLLSASGAWAQDRTGDADRLPPQRAGESNAPHIRVDADLVLIPVVVTDRDNHLITGLERAHFRLWEDKVEQVITHFAAEDAPVSIALVFDSSGSMGDKLRKSRAAVTEFLKTANPEDEFSLIQFSDEAQVLQTLTSRSEDIQNRLRSIEARGRTALLDGILMAMDELKNAKHSRKAILILSDGGDNASRFTVRDLINRVREADVQIYSIGIMEPLGRRFRSPEEMAGAALLQEIAQQSGGRLFEVDDINGLPGIAGNIGMALRNQYVLGYVPATQKRDGKYHRVQVKVEPPNGQTRLRTTFRSGYFAPSN
jgi:VWFA-related protein